MLLKNSEINHSIDYYSKRLISFCELYLDKEVVSFEDDVSKEAKKRLAWITFENNPRQSIKSQILSVEISNRITDKVKERVRSYLTCIMMLLGQIGECLFIDTCMNNSLVNMKCINIANFEDDVDVKNDSIPYDEYIPFSTSLKKIFFIKNGIMGFVPNDHNDPRTVQKDIGWCLKNNHLRQLQVYKEGERNGQLVKYSDIAKIQIKVTTDCTNIKADKYRFTPLIVFDLCNDVESFKERHPQNIIYSMREIYSEAETEIEYYFKILAAYATGISDHIDIDDFEISNNTELQSIFSMSLQQLKIASPSNYQKIIDLVGNNNQVYTLSG
ncbi:MAG: hypothetical protein K2H89_04765 [Oscillospiraceae bacterium]|nr:hypothetical protein [Oscillospiraceae bacterium]